MFKISLRIRSFGYHFFFYIKIKLKYFEQAFGDSNMAALHYQNLMVGTNNNAEHAMEDEPDPREVKVTARNSFMTIPITIYNKILK